MFNIPSTFLHTPYNSRENKKFSKGQNNET